ncbi:MAG: hypothetical protein AMS22_02895 [Thiotrichales bacterium SG8_50]|nr:MAG: hypothetical protein AMS22_02895 [Thiotrichales bacterium SG8_50]
MIRLTHALSAWGTPDFQAALQAELQQLSVEQLPLQQGLATSGYALDGDMRAMILSVSDDETFIHARVGIFYTGVVAGCSCADDPTPINENNEYCEIEFAIHKATAEATATLC